MGGSAIIMLNKHLNVISEYCFILTRHLLVIRYVGVYKVHLLFAARFFDTEGDPFAGFNIDVQYNYFLQQIRVKNYNNVDDIDTL